MTANSVQLEQDHDWRPRHARLWGAHAPRQPIMRLIPPPPPEPEPEPVERDWLIIEPTPLPDTPTPPPSPMIPHWKIILREVAIEHKLNITDLLSTRRARNIVAARHRAMFRMKTETSLSLPSIGKRLGGLDHTTVIHGLRRYELLRAAEAAS